METFKKFRKMRDTIVRGLVCYFKLFRKTDVDVIVFSENTSMIRIPGDSQIVEAVEYSCVIRKKGDGNDTFATVYDTRAGFVRKYKTIIKHGGYIGTIISDIWKTPCRASVYGDYGDHIVFLEDTEEKPIGILTLGKCLKKTVEYLNSEDTIFSAVKGFSKEFFEFGFLCFTDSENRLEITERNGNKTVISDRYKKVESPENKLVKSIFGQQLDEEVSAAVKKAAEESTPSARVQPVETPVEATTEKEPKSEVKPKPESKKNTGKKAKTPVS